MLVTGCTDDLYNIDTAAINHVDVRHKPTAEQEFIVTHFKYSEFSN